jgi:hypothetical protein
VRKVAEDVQVVDDGLAVVFPAPVRVGDLSGDAARLLRRKVTEGRADEDAELASGSEETDVPENVQVVEQLFSVGSDDTGR